MLKILADEVEKLLARNQLIELLSAANQGGKDVPHTA